MALLSGFALLLYLAIFGFSIYMLVLFIKLAHRGIRALDIYIDKNSRGNIENDNINRYE